MMRVDVVVIGAGPGGLAAAASAAINGAKVVLLEREKTPGGILNQCIHDGFGLVRYQEQLSGPEYAARSMSDAVAAGVEVVTSAIVTEIVAGAPHVVRALCSQGVLEIEAKSIVLATGCRERTRGMIGIPGSRPAGVYTAGVVQNLMNIRNIMVGRNVVILGTGDIGLIMARRMSLEGANVICAIEINDDVCGLSRNVQQCLQDYEIPVYLSHTVTNIIGKNRLEAIEMAAIDENGDIIDDTRQVIECDTLVLSVGLIPENEVAQTGGVAIDIGNNGAITDVNLQTSVPGIFACGNCRSVMDLADFVTQQGELAGANAAAFAFGCEMSAWEQELHNAARKGIPQDGSTTCTLCPKGCSLVIDEADNVIGNNCPKGEEFMLLEKHNPQRILTSTVRIDGASRQLLPVRSDRYVCLDEIREIVNELGKLCVTSPVVAGQIIMSDVGKNHANIIAQCDL